MLHSLSFISTCVVITHNNEMQFSSFLQHWVVSTNLPVVSYINKSPLISRPDCFNQSSYVGPTNG